MIFENLDCGQNFRKTSILVKVSILVKLFKISIWVEIKKKIATLL